MMQIFLANAYLGNNFKTIDYLKTFYIIRHGETEYNRKGMVQGSGIDAPLNDTGQQQAEAFYQAYKGVGFDKVYTSNLIRTQQTVQKFLDRPLPHEALKDLREIGWGIQEGVEFTPETTTGYQQICDEWNKGNCDVKIEGGESPIEVTERLKRAFEYISSQPGEETVLICVHGRLIRILMCWMLGQPLCEMDQFDHTNTGLYKVTYSEAEGYQLVTQNEVSHLQAIA